MPQLFYISIAGGNKLSSMRRPIPKFDRETLAQALVREYLNRHKLTDTLKTMDSELPRDGESIKSRNILCRALHVEQLVRKNKDKAHPDFTILGLMCDHMVTCPYTGVEEGSVDTKQVDKASKDAVDSGKDEEAAEKKRLEEEAVEKKRLEEEAAEKKRLEEEAAEKKRLEEEAAEKKILEEEAAEKKRLEEEAAEKKRLDEEAAEKKRLEEEAAEKKRLEEEAAEKKRLEEEVAEKKMFQLAPLSSPSRGKGGPRALAPLSSLGGGSSSSSSTAEPEAQSPGPGRAQLAPLSRVSSRAVEGKKERENAVAAESPKKVRVEVVTGKPPSRRSSAGGAVKISVGVGGKANSPIVQRKAFGSVEKDKDKEKGKIDSSISLPQPQPQPSNGNTQPQPDDSAGDTAKDEFFIGAPPAKVGWGVGDVTDGQKDDQDLDQDEDEDEKKEKEKKKKRKGKKKGKGKKEKPVVTQLPQPTHDTSLTLEEFDADNEFEEDEVGVNVADAHSGGTVSMGKPMGIDGARKLRDLIFGDNRVKEFPSEWQQGFVFSETEGMTHGIVQFHGGPCGVLAAVQSTVIKVLRSKCGYVGGALPEFSLDERIGALVEAIAEILWRAGNGESAVVVTSRAKDSAFSDDAAGRLLTYSFNDYSSLCTFLTGNIAQFYHGEGGYGIVLLLYSAVLSHGIAETYDEPDEYQKQLIGMHYYCTQELVNLLLVGHAVSNVHDGDQKMEGDMVLCGIPTRSTVGFMSVLETFGYITVGGNYKFPVYPIWVICSESHFTVIHAGDSFSVDCETGEGLPDKVDLFYYDGLANQDHEYRITVDKSIPFDAPAADDTDLVSPIDSCIRTVFQKASCDWNGDDAIL